VKNKRGSKFNVKIGQANPNKTKEDSRLFKTKIVRPRTSTRGVQRSLTSIINKSSNALAHITSHLGKRSKRIAVFHRTMSAKPIPVVK